MGIPSKDPDAATKFHEPARSSKASSGESVLGALLVGQITLTAIFGAVMLPLAALVWLSLEVFAVVPVLGGVMAYASAALLIGVSFWVMLRFFLPAVLEFIYFALFANCDDRLSQAKVDEIVERRLRGLRADFAKLRNPWRA